MTICEQSERKIKRCVKTKYIPLLITCFERDADALQDKEEALITKERKEKAYQKDHAYDDLHSADAIAASNNQERDEDFFDDFM